MFALLTISACNAGIAPNVGKVDPFDDHEIYNTKLRIAAAFGCRWPAEDLPSARCESDTIELHQRAGSRVFSIGYANPPYLSTKVLEEARQAVTKLAKMLIPEWKEAPTWLAAAIHSAESNFSHISIFGSKDGKWVSVCVFYSNGAQAPSNGYTEVSFSNDGGFLLVSCDNKWPLINIYEQKETE